MPSNSDFRYDLQLGKLGEKKLQDILENKKIEIKTDFQSKTTGNVFVEYRSRGKNSGIFKTECDYYCFILGNTQLVLISIGTLQEKCCKYFNTGRDILGGDNYTSRGILLPVLELVK